jgi:hypothetical protein
MLTAVLAILVIAIAMGLIGLGVILRKRTPLRRSCRASDTVEGDGGQHCEQCACGAEAPETVDGNQ